MQDKKLFSQRAQWRSFNSYVLVTTGAVVGLGNVMSFPILVEKWGGLFVLFYILSELLISVPLLFSELLIGRRGKQNPVGSISILAMESQASSRWKMLGWLCFIILFLSLSTYTVTAAFPVLYFYEITQLLLGPAQKVAAIGLNFQADIHTIPLLSSFVFFLCMTMGVILLGINRGLEFISRITVPIYFIIFCGLAIYSSCIGHFAEACKFLVTIKPDLSILTVLFAAVTFAFFKLNIGMGTMIVYGSYLPSSVSLKRSTIVILCLDALISIFAYFTVFPLLLSDPDFGLAEHLSSDHMIEIFAHVPHALMMGLFFFFATVIAAWTPTIAMAESAVVILIERYDLSRARSTQLVGFAALILGTLVAMSYTAWPSNLHNVLADFSGDVLTTLSAIGIAIFSGWIISREITREELDFSAACYCIWRILVRYVAPVFILWIAVV